MKIRSQKKLILALTLLMSSTAAYSAASTEDLFKGKELPEIPSGKGIPSEAEVKKEVEQILNQATLEADSITYDQNTKNVVAEGNVEFGYKGQTLKSQKIEYNQEDHMLSADKGIEYKDTKGTVFKAEHIKVTDKFDKGELKEVRAEMPDGAVFRSKSLSIVSADKYKLKDSEYSPCKPCEDGSYLWNFEADKVDYNEEEGRVFYRDAYLELMGQKVFYTPYISHPTPSAKSKSGFLSPKFGNSSEYGFFTRTPYYWQPKQNMDFTFTPIITSEDGPILIAEHRHLMYNGFYEVEVSGAYPKERDQLGNQIPGANNEFRGHFKGKGNVKFSDNWSWGFDAARSTDDTYLRRYNLGTYEDVLNSEIYINRFHDRNYFSTKALAFQGLRATDDPDISPYVAPLVEAGRTFEVSDNYSQRITADANAMFLRRDQGADSNRLIGKVGYQGGYVTDGGMLMNYKISNRMDYYNVHDVTVGGTNFEGAENRYIPTASLTLSYPMQKVADKYSLVLEPVVMTVMSSSNNNKIRIPNEDSQNFELYEYNLFQEQHISGYDLVEDGFRTNYGVRGILTTQSIGDYNFLLGQSFREDSESAVFTPQTGLSDNLSDYVGRVVTTGKRFSSGYRFRVDKDSYQFRRNELGFSLNYDPVILGTSYTFSDGYNTGPDRQELYNTGKFKLTDEWSFIGNTRRNLDNSADAGWISVGGGLEFMNDCFTSSVELRREFVRDRDIQPSTEIIFKFTLQNFGS